MCGGLDHHSGDYTPTQRADLDLVLAFNRRMSDAINQRVDISGTEAYLDPDPLRYMWVDEGQGQIAATIANAQLVLDEAPLLEGHERQGVAVVPGSAFAARPSVSVGADGARLVAWIEWREGEGDVVQAAYQPAPALSPAEPRVVSGAVADVFRPTALITATGVPWVFYGRSTAGRVSVWATWLLDHTSANAHWSRPEEVSTSAHPSFNQEVAAHRDGRIELCWQGRNSDR
ncbi:MAG: hypothetical protein ABWX96_04930, partial [Propionibacteriaceae bacterium]